MHREAGVLAKRAMGPRKAMLGMYMVSEDGNNCAWFIGSRRTGLGERPEL